MGEQLDHAAIAEIADVLNQQADNSAQEFWFQGTQYGQLQYTDYLILAFSRVCMSRDIICRDSALTGNIRLQGKVWLYAELSFVSRCRDGEPFRFAFLQVENLCTYLGQQGF
ncbi:hypothetical protein DPV78_001598 [Talaromyces pinophilus]|nr:hypothetical protein DPV78_001598 [Talaromyces pinophilus]